MIDGDYVFGYAPDQFLFYSGMLQVGIILTTVIGFKGCFALHGIANDDGNSTSPILVEYVLLQEQHPCNRTCIQGEHPRVCKYDFVVEWYQTMSKACYSCPYDLEDCKRPDCVTGDGRKRPIVVVNRRMPGPGIEVCLGDEVMVNVQNHLMVESTSIHWHGQHQVNTPYMDGVPFVTQCPIQPSTSFTYRFRPANVGTHFWHSHSGMQRADGAYGSLIVREPKEQDPHRELYDRDVSSHTIIIIDWTEETGMNKFIAHHHSTGDNKPSTLLVNGKGRYLEFKNRNADNIDTITYTPVERFYVEQGFRYRFRIINAGVLNCPIEFSIDNHTLLLISTDGNDIEAIEAESIVTYAGERFDFIINANQSGGLYWMRFKGLMDCDERFTKAFQTAILQYSDTSDSDYPDGDVPTYETSHKEGLQINPLNVGVEGSNDSYLPMALLKSIQDWDESLSETVDFQYYISYDFYYKDNPMFHRANVYGFYNISEVEQQRPTPQLNNITMKLLPFAMLSERSHLKPEMFCNESTIKNMECAEGFCQCTHVVQIALGAVVEVILIDTGFAYDANHPFHIHGHSFRVVGMERLSNSVTTDEILKLEEKNLLKRNLDNPPIKDTVTVPDGGYTIIRFVASNPGYWFFHCHLEFHVEIGMGLIFKVGEDSDMPPVPKNFPRCGNYNDPLETSLLEHLWAALFTNSSTMNTGQISTLILTLMLLIISR